MVAVLNLYQNIFNVELQFSSSTRVVQRRASVLQLIINCYEIMFFFFRWFLSANFLATMLNYLEEFLDSCF